MPRNPDGATLLEVAREILLKDLLPLLPQDRRVDVLMIANAMGVAARELTSGSLPLETEFEGLGMLLGREDEPGGESVAEAIERMRWLLASEIRAGKRDGDLATHRCLTSIVLAYLSESNPKVLKAAGLIE